jgi:catechol 2,3-dioxygenase
MSVNESHLGIHPATRIGSVHLTVADLERQVTFYQSVIGLTLHRREPELAVFGDGHEELLFLTELQGARRLRGTTGLYHLAILLPNRRELARALGRLITLRYPNGPTDHVMTKTTYLDDPEGNGIELYCESPEDGFFGMVDGQFVARDVQGRSRSGRDPLDVEALLSHLTAADRLDQPMPVGTRIGHVHLHVANVPEAMHFYRDVIGFGNMGDMESVGFVSAGGYHHHVGFNTWAGEGAPPPLPGATGLRYFTVVLPDQAELARVFGRVREAGILAEERPEGILLHDPSLNGLMLTVAASMKE